MTVNIRKILFVTDLSNGSREVFQYAVNLASALNASIVMLYVMDTGPTTVGVVPGGVLIKGLLGSEGYENLKKEQEENARRVLLGKQTELPIIRAAMEKLSEDQPPRATDVKIDDIIVKQGKVADEIILEAKYNNCDLIVMGHDDDGFIAQALLGKKTARAVTERSEVPVLLVPMESE